MWSLFPLIPFFAFWWPALRWMASLLDRPELKMQLGIAAMLSVYGAIRALKNRPEIQGPYGRGWPLFFLFVPIVVALKMHRLADLDVVNAGCFALSSWGLIGLYIPFDRWLRLLPVLSLGLGLLPAEVWMDALLGYPLRVWTATQVGQLLSMSGLAHLDHQTLLSLDMPDNIHHTAVDVPCAGIRSLWSASLILTLLAVLRGRSPDFRMLLAFIGMFISLIFTNTLRVLVLVWSGGVLGWTLLAQRLHIPLGLFGFSLSLGLGMVLLGAQPAPIQQAPPLAPRRGGIVLGLCLSFCLGIFLDVPAQDHLNTVGFKWQPPATMQRQPAASSAQELAFFRSLHLPDVPEEFSFQTETLQGTGMLVPASSWRGHHLPSQCQGYLGVSEERSLLLAPDLLVRTALVDQKRSMLVWWFEAPDRRSDDLFARAWADLSGRQSRWVMVSLRVQGQPDLAELAPFLQQLAMSVRNSFIVEPV